jgi:hypothetical protein
VARLVKRYEDLLAASREAAANAGLAGAEPASVR